MNENFQAQAEESPSEAESHIETSTYRVGNRIFLRRHSLMNVGFVIPYFEIFIIICSFGKVLSQWQLFIKFALFHFSAAIFSDRRIC